MTSRLYLNNASSDIAVELASSYALVEVEDASVFATAGSPTSSSYVVATIDDGAGAIEVVHITNIGTPSANHMSLVRGQEGTSAAQVWAEGTVIQARITAAILTAADPQKGSNGTVVGEGAATTGDGSVAVGKLADAIGFDAIAIGNLAVATGNDSLAIGDAATTASTGNIALGSDAVATGSNAIAIGKNADVGSSVAIAIGYNSDVDGTAAIGIGDTVVVSGGGSIGIGDAVSVTSSVQTIVIGQLASGTGIGGIALGPYSSSLADKAIGIGSTAKAHALRSTAIGYIATAQGEQSIAIGPEAESYVQGQFKTTTAPVIAREAGWFASAGGPQQAISAPVVIYSPTVNLGVVPDWTTAVTYPDNSVVQQATPSETGEQFTLVMGYNDGTYYQADQDTVSEVTESGSEPTFVHVNQGQDKVATNADANAFWVFFNPGTGLDIAVNKLAGDAGTKDIVRFFPTKVGFICLEWVDMTTSNPVISIGNDLVATAYVNNEALVTAGSTSEQATPFTAAEQIRTWAVTDGQGISNIKFKLDTAGAGGSGTCVGRFFVEGYYATLLG